MASYWRGGLLAVGLGMGVAMASCNDAAPDRFVIPPFALPPATEAGAPPLTEEGGTMLDPTLGGPCTDDAQCDDLVACTFDRCDKTLSRCRNVPDDTQCADGMYCNGEERCVLRQGCAPGPVVTCEDADNCTIDHCDEATKTCTHGPRDADGDGDPDDHCAPKHDCDDTDPTVSSLRTEICGNFQDDDCDGLIDEQPCSVAANDTCAAALAIGTAGIYRLTTVAAKKDYGTTCSVESPAAAQDIVVAITTPLDGPHDVLVRAAAASAGDLAIALEATCGTSASELACTHLASSVDARAIARSVAAGTTIYAVVTTAFESVVDLRVDFAAATTKPTNEGCGAPLAVPLDTAFAVSLIDPARDLPTSCPAQTGDLTYAFTLTEARDVRIFGTTTLGAGTPVISLRDTTCTSELRCRSTSSPPVFARNLQPGTHVFSVAGSAAQIDASIVVRTSAPTLAPPDQSCATAPALAPGTTFAVDLASQEAAIQNGCLDGGPSAAYALTLDAPSDVLVVGRFSLNELGAVSINTPGCLPADLLVCSSVGTMGGFTPQRASRRNLGAGSYRVVVADQKGQSAEVIALVRPTLPPTTVSADACLDAPTIPETGGFFSGDTTALKADFNAGCDTSGQPEGGAKDQLMKLVLTARRRVVFDMSGSQMTTLLDLRSGVGCPGTEVPGGCNPGTGQSRSFVDLTLDPGTYWVQIDGYNGASGKLEARRENATAVMHPYRTVSVVPDEVFAIEAPAIAQRRVGILLGSGSFAVFLGLFPLGWLAIWAQSLPGALWWTSCFVQLGLGLGSAHYLFETRGYERTRGLDGWLAAGAIALSALGIVAATAGALFSWFFAPAAYAF